jgi:aminotransferase
MVKLLDLQKITMAHAEEYKAAVNRVVESGWFLQGKENQQFEHDYAEYIGTSECITVANGLDALKLIIRGYKELGIFHDGDEIIVPANTYIATILAITDNHLVPVLVEPTWEHLEINIDRIEEAITPKTRAIMINTPSNPSGRIIPQDKIACIAELVKKYDLVVISDEVYKCLIYDHVPFKSIVAIESMRERTILINSLSKEFCMTGYRIGYVLAPEEIIAAMTKLQENVAACAPLPSQYAAIKALSGEENYSKNMVDIFTERRNVRYEGLSKIEKFSVKAPEATFYMMVDI